jgi:APA family basic amino acid/polyamine antiporter
MNISEKQHRLKKDVNFPLLVFYGLGTIIGAGIYVLVGRIADVAGAYTPYAFILAFAVAFCTALSYAELVKKFPYSGGGSLYVLEATKSDILSRIVGFLIIITTVSSAATISIGFAEYLQAYINIPQIIVVLSLILLLSYVAIKGIKESAILVASITAIEVGGLCYTIYIANDLITFANIFALNTSESFDIEAILVAALVAFYAFIGFEDMANIAEEVKKPRKVIMSAMVIVLLIVAVLYICIAAIVSNIDLQSTEAPLKGVIEQRGYDPVYITIIGLLATLNGVIVHLVLSSRVLYGMAKKNNAPKIFSKLHSKNKTPHIAILFVSLIIIGLTSVLEILSLAKLSSYIILTVFFFVNASLIIIELKDKNRSIFNGIILPLIANIMIAVFLVANVIN